MLNCLAFMMDPALYVAIVSLRKYYPAYFKDGDVLLPNIHKQLSPNTDAAFPEAPASPSATEFNVPFSPASCLLRQNRKNSMVLPPRPTTILSTMMNPAAQASHQSFSFYRFGNDSAYSQFNSRLSTFIQGL